MIVSPCKNGNIDPVWYDLFKGIESPYPIVIVTKLENYQFNEELLKLGKYILVCGVEYGWDFPLDRYGTHIWGINTYKYNFGFDTLEWRKFDDFVSNNEPILIFKREIMKGFDTNKVVPINYPCWDEIPEIQSKEEFDARPLQTNFIWGLSHEYRKYLHGEIWQRAGEFGYVVCDNISNVVPFIQKEDNPKKWLTANVPWYARYKMNIITSINTISKISISISGAGRHCFRHSESPMCSTMFLWEDGIKYSYPWIHNVNCIMSEQGKEIETIIEALKNPDLYSIYLAGVENCRKYSLLNYQQNYILPIINSL